MESLVHRIASVSVQWRRRCGKEPCLAVAISAAETPSLSLSRLESHLQESANILRGPVDAADFKTYIFPPLFFKRISDVHDEELPVALEAIPQEDDEDRTKALLLLASMTPSSARKRRTRDPQPPAPRSSPG